MGYARYPIVTVLGLVGGAPGGETPRVADSCSREGLDDGLGEGLGRLRVLPGH